jgi:hypothetical protein
MPVPEPEGLTTLSRAGSPLISCADYLDYRDRNRAFTALGATLPTESSLELRD